MEKLEQIARHIAAAVPTVKTGPMRLWGQPLGRPGEDGHTLVGCDALKNCLRLRFKNDELLAVWNPSDVEIGPLRFRIRSADEMRFTWYLGDRPRNPENILYRDYSLHEGLIVFRSNADAVPGSGWLPESTAQSKPAVEIAN